MASHIQPRVENGTEDEDVCSNASDYDSEWTQLSSFEDDLESLPDFARPSSRQFSIDGGYDERDRWEGLAEDEHRPEVADETVSFSTASDSEDVISDADSASHERRDAGLVATESELYKSFDMSVTGTLDFRRSRSTPNSLNSSLTDSQPRLRLSFPDPLQRLDGEIDRTTETHPSIDSPVDPAAHDNPNTSDEGAASSFSDLGASSTPNVSVTVDADSVMPVAPIKREPGPCLLSIFLYGSASSSLRWNVAERILSLCFTDLPDGCEKEEALRTYYFIRNDKLVDSFFVRIIDRTLNIDGMVSKTYPDLNFPAYTLQNNCNGPSLAIIFLPSLLSTLPDHSRYLPLLDANVNDSQLFESFGGKEFLLESALFSWKKLALPDHKRIKLLANNSNPIVEITELDRDELLDKQSFASLLVREKDRNKLLKLVADLSHSCGAAW